jgi:hypothetical protein
MKEKISKSEFVKKYGYFVPTLHGKYVEGVELSSKDRDLKKLRN